MPKHNLDEYSRSVFINCPFDQDYLPIFRAIIFTVIICEFKVRSARELDDTISRIDKIYSIIEKSRFGVHDISRTELDTENDLPRFNMPLELGVFLGAKRYGGKIQKDKRAIILDTEPYRYQKFISDLAGMDPHPHGGEPERCIREVRNWLATVANRKLTSPELCIEYYQQFTQRLPELCALNRFDISDISYLDFINIVTAWLQPE